ncbi:CHASE domain-containing protein [Massilia sp. LXY-6]|uniref:sensor histidine kinase n=1 Tax=Massilia sp. LXY-6 TaxID=3379823 RepID=UPI003EE0E1BF
MQSVLGDAFSVGRISFWTGLLLSSTVGGVLYVSMSRSIESDAHERFYNHVKYAQSMIGVRAKAHTGLLRGAASLIQSSGSLTHDQFHEYVRGLQLAKHFPAVDLINYATYLTKDQREPFLAAWRAEMQSGVKARLDITPPGIRPAYLVISHIEPDPSSPKYFGVDLMANRFFGQRLVLERDQGTVQASGTPIPMLSKTNDAHLGMRMAVYRRGLPSSTVEERRAAYIGSVGISFSVPKLLHGVVDEIPIRGLRMIVYDTGPYIDRDGQERTDWPFTLYDSRGTSANPRPPIDTGSDIFSAELPLDFNARPWKIVYSVPKSALYTEFDIYYAKMMAAFGFFGSMLLYALLRMLTSSRRAALALAQEMTSELRDSQRKLQLSHQKLRRLADHAYQIKELERKRIAREIHDDLGQNLLALRIDAEMLAARTRDRHSQLHQRARKTLMQIDATIKSVRQIINDLRPNVLDLGLSAAVEWQLNEFQRRTGINCELHDLHGEISPCDACATAFFRILQESLTNIQRHANAHKVVVELRLDGNWLSMSVKDNGCGLAPGGRNKQGSFGLVGIEERVVILGGSCQVLSGPDGGTTVTVSVPMVDTPQIVAQPPQEHESGPALM